MNTFETLTPGKRYLYSTNYYSGNYNHIIYVKKAIDDGSNKPKFYISIFTNINGIERQIGYLYFYVDYKLKTCNFIGLKVEPKYRGLNIGSFLVATWIDLCLNNGYNFLGTNEKQRKPFLLYLLKTYGFEILDTTLYETRDDVISICKYKNKKDKSKLLIFKDSYHEKSFKNTNSYTDDNYVIIDNPNNKIIVLDKVIMPIQNRRKNNISYNLLDHSKAETKSKKILIKHKK